MNKIIKKIRTASPAAKASMALLFANLILKGLSMISGPIFTRIMSADQYGIVSTFQSWQNLFAVIVTLNLSQGVFNNGMLDFRSNRDQFQFTLLSISTICTGIFFGVFQIFKRQLLNFFEMPEIMIYIMILYFLFVPSFQLWSGRQRYEYKYKALTVITIGMGVFALVLGIILVTLSPQDIDAIARVCAMEGVNIAVGVFLYLYIGFKAKFKISWDYCKYALKFNVPLIPHYLSMYVLASSDRIMITKLVDAASTAIYSVAYTVASVIQIVWSSIEASLSPWIYEKLDSNDKESVKKLTSQIILLFAVLCLGCTLFAPEIMTILAPSTYSEGIYAIPSVATGVFFTAVYSLYMRIELFYKKTGFATIASVCAALSNIIFNYIFINIFGFIAAGYTTMVCYAFLAFFHYLNVRRKRFDDALNNKSIFCTSIAVIVLSVLITFLYSFSIIRYGIIAISLLVLFINRKRIWDIMQKKKITM